MTNAEIAARADFALADLTAGGGLLNADQSNQFLDMVTEESTLIQSIRTVRMKSSSMKINRIGFGGRILRAASETGGQNDSGSNDRNLPAAQRAKVQTQQIQMDTSEIIAEVRIPYEVLEDNIEGANFEDHIMRLIAGRAALDLEELALFADTGSSDSYLALQNGFLKRATQHIVDNTNAGPNDNLFVNGLLALPQKYLRYLDQMRAWVSVQNTIKMRQSRAARATALGDASVTGTGPLITQGLNIVPAPALAVDGIGKMGLMTYPQNLIMGVQRDITVETDKEIRSREYVIVLTMRVAFQIEDTDAVVKFVNI